MRPSKNKSAGAKLSLPEQNLGTWSKNTYPRAKTQALELYFYAVLKNSYEFFKYVYSALISKSKIPIGATYRLKIKSKG